MISEFDMRGKDPQAVRQKLLASAGVDAKNQHVATHTLQQVQSVAVLKADQACIEYLRRWVPELKGLEPKRFSVKLAELNAVFSALFRTTEKLLGENSLTYGLARKYPDGRVEKKEFEIKFRVLPALDTKGGAFSLAVEHQEIDWPAHVKVVDSAA